MKRFLPLILIFVLIPSITFAKKKKKEEETASNNTHTTSITANNQAAQAQARVNSLTGDSRRDYDALSDEQKSKIQQGQIDLGFNEWMVKLALGEPFYASEHHPVYVDYQQVWLYTKKEIIDSKMENQIIDPQTNWPTVHRVTNRKTCTVGDFFVLWDRGVVEKVTTDPEKKIFGSCTMESSEAFLPIVNGVPVEPK